MHKLVDTKIHKLIKAVKESTDITLCFYAKSREINGSKREISSSCHYLTSRVICVTDNSCAATHVSYLSVRIALFIIL